jgi:hypothetical protein
MVEPDRYSIGKLLYLILETGAARGAFAARRQQTDDYAVDGQTSSVVVHILID